MDINSVKTKLKNKQDLTFLSLGILMSILVFLGIFYAISFLTQEIGIVLNSQSVAAPSPVKFDLDKIKTLGIENMQK
ncbi:MAG: hypothetical protein M1155_00340 [Patescibacteria group bacterium]|nr:hypothetical protein [Patescibacteria group bacterium]